MKMKRIVPLLVASSLSWPVGFLSQPIQLWAAPQSDAAHTDDAHGDGQKRHRVDCDQAPTGALHKAIARADPGDTLIVSGTCHEHVTVPVDKNSITLDGGGTAAISGSDPAQPTVLVRGSDVTIRGFTDVCYGNRSVLRSAASRGSPRRKRISGYTSNSATRC